MPSELVYSPPHPAGVSPVTLWNYSHHPAESLDPITHLPNLQVTPAGEPLRVPTTVQELIEPRHALVTVRLGARGEADT